MEYSKPVTYKIGKFFIKFLVVCSKDKITEGVTLPYNNDDMAKFGNEPHVSANNFIGEALKENKNPIFTLEAPYVSDTKLFQKIILSLFRQAKKQSAKNKDGLRDICFRSQAHPATRTAEPIFSTIYTVAGRAKAELICDENNPQEKCKRDEYQNFKATKLGTPEIA